MRVFVLCTGRCGSVTFATACNHITNFTSGNETTWGHVGLNHLAYAQNHIEVDNRLSWMLGSLEQQFAEDTFFVHLTRNPELVALSHARRWGRGIIRGYSEGILR